MARNLTAYKKDYLAKNRDMIHKKDCERYPKEAERRKAKAKEWAKNNPEARKAIEMRFRFKLEYEDFAKLIEKQQNFCGICKIEMTKPVVDHDHKCCPGYRACGKCIRGLLCVRCNTNLGVYEKWSQQYSETIKEYLNGKT